MLAPAVDDDRSVLQRWVDDLGAETFQKLWQSFPLEVREAYAYDWSKIARPKQLPPPGDWLLWMVRAGRGFGKALALGTPLPTPAGWTTMGEVQVGDKLFDENGLPCRVTYATEIQLGRPCFEVEFDDGSTIVADGEHRWLTWTKAARKAHGRASRPTIHPAVVTTTQIRDTLRVQGGREVNHSVAVSGCLKLPPADLPIDPYVLGVWLGDGDNKAATVTTGDDEQWQLLEKAGAKVGKIVFDPRTNAQRATVDGSPAARGPNGRMVSNGSLHSKLRKIGLLNNKHVPAVYLRADPGQRLAILQGLMDTDGSCSPGGNVEFCSTSHELAHGVLELALGLGMKAVVYGGRAMLRGKDCGPKYRVCWTPHVPMFRLSRKLARQHGGKRQRTRTHHRYIVGVRPVPTVPVRCIQVDSPSHLFLAGRTMIPTHNTRTGAEWIRMGVESGECGRVALIGPTAADTRDVMVEGTSGILAISPNHWRPEYEPSKRRLTWPNGAVGTLYSAEEPDRLRGPQHDRAWADELAAWAQLEETWDMLQFGLRLGEHPQALDRKSVV